MISGHDGLSSTVRFQAGLIQSKAARPDRIGRRDGKIGFLAVFHQPRPEFEFGLVGRRPVHQAFDVDVGESRFVVTLGFEDFGFMAAGLPANPRECQI